MGKVKEGLLTEDYNDTEKKLTLAELPYCLADGLKDIPLEEIEEVKDYFNRNCTLYIIYLDKTVDFRQMGEYLGDTECWKEFIEYAMYRCPNDDEVILLCKAIGHYIEEHRDSLKLEIPPNYV